MKRIILLSGFFISALIFSESALSQSGSASSPESKIQFPIAELGGCKDKADCKSYCDNPENSEACLSFASKSGLMKEGEVKIAKKMLSIKGPGGCSSKEECENYCDSMDRISECVDFAEKNDIMPPKDLEEAKKIKSALERGVKPPACRSKKECDNYCSDVLHIEECMTFALGAGLMNEGEKEEAKKVLEAVKKGAKPPRCGGKEACDAYCSEDSHFEECMAFAEAAGFMKPEEAEMARKTGGKGPGNCRGQKECDAFCEKEENFPTCVDFALKYGLMSEKDAEMAKKTGGKGPGGCKGRECEDFCKKEENQETCFEFGLKNGMIPEKDLQRMEEAKKQMSEAVKTAPSEVIDCLRNSIGEDKIEAIRQGSVMPSQKTGESLEKCLKGFQPQREERERVGGEERRRRMTLEEIVNQVPPEVRGCVASSLTEKDMESPDPSKLIDPVMERCFRENKPPEGARERFQGEPPRNEGEFRREEMPEGGFQNPPFPGERMMPEGDRPYPYEGEQFRGEIPPSYPPPAEGGYRDLSPEGYRDGSLPPSGENFLPPDNFSFPPSDSSNLLPPPPLETPPSLPLPKPPPSPEPSPSSFLSPEYIQAFIINAFSRE